MQQRQAKDKVTFAGNVCRTAPDCASLILQVTVIVFQSVVLNLLVVQDSKQQEQQHMLRLSHAITTARLHRAVRLLWMPRLRRSACTPAHHLEHESSAQRIPIFLTTLLSGNLPDYHLY